MVFFTKNLVLVNWVILSPKMARPSSSGSICSRNFFWTHSHGWKDPLNRVSPSVCPCDSFLGIDLLVFSETLHGDRGPYSDVLDS